MGEDIYRFGHRWVVRGPIETIFGIVGDARTFKDWFTVFKSVSVDDPVGPVRVGSHSTMRVKALLPYALDWDITVVRQEPPLLQETAVRVSLGGRFGMHGRIRFRFEDQGDGTVVVWNEQEIAADRPLPRLLHPVAQALFAVNHRWAMKQAAAPLQAIVAGAASMRKLSG